jgi:hypothetical protein
MLQAAKRRFAKHAARNCAAISNHPRPLNPAAERVEVSIRGGLQNLILFPRIGVRKVIER